MSDAAQKLAAMFEADREASDYFERFPMYGWIHAEIGCKPWHPPAEQVWWNQGEPMDYDDPGRVAEVWAILSGLYGDYMGHE